MIDEEKLDQAYRNDGIYALQLEIGDICHQGCSYCYMNALPVQKNNLSDDVIIDILHESKKLGVTAIEWLGGEPLLRESVFDLMAAAADLGFLNNMWTGGLPLGDSVILKKTADLCRRGLIAFHLSTIDPGLYGTLHPGRPESDLSSIIHSVRNLLEYGYPADRTINSVTYTGLQSADDMIATINFFEEKFGIKTSINVYHTYLRPGSSRRDLDRFIPDSKSVARIHKRWARQYGVKQMPMNCVNKQYCSATVAVLCDGSVTPCATIREEKAPNIHRDGRLSDIVGHNRDHLLFMKFKRPENLPEDCRKCDLSNECWGCRSRSYAAGLGMYAKDPRCFRYQKK